METLTKIEQFIMKCIWEFEKPPTVYDINNVLKEKYHLEYTRSTTRTYLTKLEKKGYIELKRDGMFSYIFPVMSEQEYCKNQMKYMKDFWFGGSAKEMSASLTELIEDEERRIEGLIDEFDD